jgi:hypothetical protein
MYNSVIANVLAGTMVRFDATPCHFDPFWTGMSLIHILEGKVQWKIQPPHTSGDGEGCKRHSVMGKCVKWDQQHAVIVRDVQYYKGHDGQC